MPLALCLVACGGSGTGASSGAGAGGNANTSTNTIDAYTGTYTSTCFLNANVTSATTGSELYEVDTLVVGTASSTSKASATSSASFYSAQTCSGSPLVTLKASGSNTFLNLDGSETVSGEAVEKVDTSRDPFFPGISAGSITMSTVKFTGAALLQQTPVTSKQIWKTDASDHLFVGDLTHPLDSSGYPTVLETAFSFTKS